MSRSAVVCHCLLAIFLTSVVAHSGGATETASQKAERLRWWREGRFGMFIHWGPVSLKGTEISWSRGGERRGIGGKGEIPVEVYDNLYREFNPVLFRSDEWVAAARTAGMKYMVLTAKHCDGFCLWRSQVDDYCMSNTPSGKDVCGELADAAHRAGMKIGWYYSPMDWRDPDCRTGRNEIYLKKMRGHLRELMGNYGRIDLLWFDYDGGPNPWDQANTYALVRSLQPGLIIDDRLGLGPGEDNVHNRLDENSDYRTPEQRVGAFDRDVPWETCMTIGTQWSWKPADRIKSAGECIRILVQCVTGDGNLLLDVGPMPDGRIEPRQVDVLKGIGAWLAKYGGSIYGTRGGPFRNGTWGGATCKGNVIYLHVANWEKGRLLLPTLDAKIRKYATLTGGNVRVAQKGEGTLLEPEAGSRDETDTIIRLEIDRSAEEMVPLPVRGINRWEARSVSVRLRYPAGPQYPAKGVSSLLDGEKGSTDRNDGAWLGFEGTDFEALYDLHTPARISRVTLGCLQEQVSRVFFPARVEIALAGDDSVFRPAHGIETGTPVEDAEIRRGEFSVTFEPSLARYLRIRAVNTGVCPPWHPSAGAKAWLLIDETVIE
ncbi:MAG TPA: alpha-L-fucosidase [Bacteroidota bacterium]|nr:alpha-L-fucosidase [Bacteroidota bacterium]